MLKRGIDWLSIIDILLILLGLFIIYPLLRALFGGSWQTESLIISLVIFNLVLTWHISMKMGGHISWHKAKDKN
jgi:uncharacterized membrane protein